MSDITHLPTRAEFIRDQLAELRDGGVSYHTGIQCPSCGAEVVREHCAARPGSTRGIVLLLCRHDARCRSEYADLGLKDFAVDPVPTDTGVMHGPLSADIACSDGSPRYDEFGTFVVAREYLPGLTLAQAALHHVRPAHRVPGTTRTV